MELISNFYTSLDPGTRSKDVTVQCSVSLHYGTVRYGTLGHRSSPTEWQPDDNDLHCQNGYQFNPSR